MATCPTDPHIPAVLVGLSRPIEGLTVRGLSAEQVGGLALAHGILLHYLAPARVSLEEAFMELAAREIARGDRIVGMAASQLVV